MKAEEILGKMLEADPELYEKILDTPGFAFYFNELAKLAFLSQQTKAEEVNVPDLKTLEYVRNQFQFHSDNSVSCNGYHWLEKKIDELQNSNQ